MFRIRILSFLPVLLCLTAWAIPTEAVQVEGGSVYCFTAEDFPSEEPLAGICLTSLPDDATGCLMLGSRTLRPGDILTAGQVSQMTFHPLRTEIDRSAEVGYLPIYDNHVAASAAMTISVMGKENKAPIAEDLAAETYKNLATTGNLKVTEPESEAMTFQVGRQPRRGTVIIHEDGSFTYTPKKNKVGVDSFTFTATDASGKVSREATVTITILKPTGSAQYSDTTGKDCRFEAEWMKNTGIFTGEKLAGQSCFQPDREVTRGEFLTMLVKALEIPTDENVELTAYTDEIPQWLQPYLSAAVRSGLTSGLPEQEIFGAGTPITGAEAAVMVQNALELRVFSSADAVDAAAEDCSPEWALSALTALNANGLSLEGTAVLTRSDAAKLLYQAVQWKDISVFTE